MIQLLYLIRFQHFRGGERYGSPEDRDGGSLTSQQWCDFFEANAASQQELPWEEGAGIAEAELAEIAESLQAWQLGETSDGRHLLRAARQYVRQTGDSDFVQAARLFIVEEQRHGELLGRFLDLAGCGRVSSNWGDTLFRAFRYALPRMEVWVTPVLMTEILAMVYYNAIRQSTGSPLLQAICKQILADEVPHIRFQCERLAILHQHRAVWLRALTLWSHRFLFFGIVLAVWLGHRRALRAGGYSFSRFWKAAWSRMRHAWKLMNPRAYQWSDSHTIASAR